MTKYRRHYLSSVLVRVDFAGPPGDIDVDLPSEIVATIKKKFPLASAPQARATRNMIVDPGAGGVTAGGMERWKRWDFYSKNRNKYVSIERDFFLINYGSHYSSFKTLKAECLDILAAIKANFPDVSFARLGLRYIDTFPAIDEGDTFDWKGWIRPSRLAALKVVGVKDHASVTKIMQTLEMVHDDLRVRHLFGMPNPDYPSRIKQKHFVLDSDAFYDTRFEADEVPAMLDKCHDRIRSFFEDSITDKMRDHLNAPKKRG